jgi:hypothetical protein
LSESTLNTVATVVLNFTEVAPVNPPPMIVTVSPTNPAMGVKFPMPFFTANAVVELPVAATLVTEMLPVVAPAGTTAVIIVADTTLKIAAGVPLNCTAVLAAKFDPVIVTVAPTDPLVGVKVDTTGPLITVKLAALVPVPPGVVTLIVLVTAAAGTVVVI